MESRLKKAFIDGEFSAYTKLKLVRWAGVCIDVYASKICQLARRVGFAGPGHETAMKLAFMTGFLNNISMELQQAPAIESLTMGDLLTQVRVLRQDTAEDIITTTQFPQSEGEVSFEVKCLTGINC